MKIDLFTIGFGRPELLYHQKRLLDKFLGDEFGLCLIDNTPGIQRNRMERVCAENGVGYIHSPGTETSHDHALNFAAAHVASLGSDYFGFLDADIFPRRKTTLIGKIDQAGFYGMPQLHKPTGVLYPWPGFCFFSKEWVAGRTMNFSGIRGPTKEEDGDCGSMLHSLFAREDWKNLPLTGFSYGNIRGVDEVGIQSWGYEIIGDWIHFMNSSHWLQVPNPSQRDLLLLEMIKCL